MTDEAGSKGKKQILGMHHVVETFCECVRISTID